VPEKGKKKKRAVCLGKNILISGGATGERKKSFGQSTLANRRGQQGRKKKAHYHEKMPLPAFRREEEENEGKKKCNILTCTEGAERGEKKRREKKNFVPPPYSLYMRKARQEEVKKKRRISSSANWTASAGGKEGKEKGKKAFRAPFLFQLIAAQRGNGEKRKKSHRLFASCVGHRDEPR